MRVCFDPNIRPNRWGGDHGPRSRPRANWSRVRSSFGRTGRGDGDRGRRRPAAGRRRARGDGRRAGGRHPGRGGRGDPRSLRGRGPGGPGRDRHTLGAGDAFMGTLVAGLALRDWDAARPAKRSRRRSMPPGRRARAGSPRTDQPATVAASASASRSASSGVLCRWGEMRSELPRTAAKQPASASAAGAAALTTHHMSRRVLELRKVEGCNAHEACPRIADRSRVAPTHNPGTNDTHPTHQQQLPAP